MSAAQCAFMHARCISTVLLGLAALLPAAAIAADQAEVRVIRAPAWSQGDAVREGAGEFLVLMDIARLANHPARAGLVGVGDRRGLFGPGAEQAMHQVTMRGVPVVKLAPNGRVLPAPHGLFIDGSGLSEQEACALLERCIAAHGALPVVGERAEETQLAELRERLKIYQNEFTLAAVTRLAVR